ARLDVGGGVVEPGPAAARASAEAGAEGALWGVGAAGRKLSPLAGRARAGRLPDEHGGRCDRDDAVSAGEGGDDLGGGRGAEGLDRALRGAPGVVHGLEERVGAGAECAGAAAGRGASDAVWADVPDAGDRDLGGEFPPGEGLRFILHLHQTVRAVAVEAAAAFESDSLFSARRIGAGIFV